MARNSKAIAERAPGGKYPMPDLGEELFAGLSTKQIRYILWETLPDWEKPEDCRTIKEIAERIGVHPKTVYFWRTLPHVIRAVGALSLWVIRQGIADKEVFENLVRMSSEEPKAQEIYWRLRGAITDNAESSKRDTYNFNIDARNQKVQVEAGKVLETFRASLGPGDGDSNPD